MLSPPSSPCLTWCQSCWTLIQSIGWTWRRRSTMTFSTRENRWKISIPCSSRCIIWTHWKFRGEPWSLKTASKVTSTLYSRLGISQQRLKSSSPKSKQQIWNRSLMVSVTSQRMSWSPSTSLTRSSRNNSWTKPALRISTPTVCHNTSWTTTMGCT